MAQAWSTAVVVLVASSCGGSSGDQSPAGTYAVTVTWVQPTLNTDGSPLSDLTEYRVDYGYSPESLDRSLRIADPSATSATVDGLGAGTYSFAVTALNASGFASARSQVASRTLP